MNCERNKRHELILEKQKLKEIGLTGAEADNLLRYKSSDGNVSFCNPRTGKIVVELFADGKRNIYPDELFNLRYENSNENE